MSDYSFLCFCGCCCPRSSSLVRLILHYRRFTFLAESRPPSAQVLVYDSAGHTEYYVAHQPFLTRDCLYLIVFNCNWGEARLRQYMHAWTESLVGRTNGEATVVAVGTHMDCVPAGSDVIDRLVTVAAVEFESVVKRCGSALQLSGVHVVSTITGAGMASLVNALFGGIRSMTTTGDIPSLSRGFNRATPVQWIALLEKVKHAMPCSETQFSRDQVDA